MRLSRLGRTLHGEGLVRPFDIELADEGIEARLLLQGVDAGRPCGLRLEGEVHALMAAVLLRMAGLDALDGDAEPEPPDGELGEVEQSIGTGEGNAVVDRMADGRPRSTNSCSKAVKCEVFAGGFKGFAQQQEARRVIGDGQWIAVAAVAELELALEVGAPQVVWDRAI